jgi:hypothetical protein
MRVTTSSLVPIVCVVAGSVFLRGEPVSEPAGSLDARSTVEAPSPRSSPRSTESPKFSKDPEVRSATKADLSALTALIDKLEKGLPEEKPRAKGELSRLIALLVVDTNAQNAEGIGTAVDGRLMEQALEELEEQSREEVGQDVVGGVSLTGGSVHPLVILALLEKIREKRLVRKSDVVLFYYTGHGLIPGTFNNDHYLTMSGGDLPRSVLRAALEKLGARLNIILTDCCASSPTLRARVARRGPAQWRLVQHLMKYQGFVDITASETGTPSWGSNEGAIFTAVLWQLLSDPVSEFDSNGDKSVDWKEFFARLQSDTVKLAKESRCNQKPQAFNLAYWPTYERWIKVKNDADEPLRIWLYYRTEVSKGGWRWLPENGPLRFDFAEGEESYLAHQNKRITASRIRISAEGLRSGASWTRFEDKDCWIAPLYGYEGPDVETHAHRFVR